MSICSLHKYERDEEVLTDVDQCQFVSFELSSYFPSNLDKARLFLEGCKNAFL